MHVIARTGREVKMSSSLFIFVSFLLVSVASSSDSSGLIAALIEHRLGSATYSSRVRPGADQGDPLDILINMNVNDISSISEVDMEYSMTFYLRQIWKDDRLAYTELNRSITLSYSDYDRLWSPDVFIRNLKSGVLHTLTVPNRLLRLSPDGKIFFSQRLTVTLFCSMQLDRYPMDNQTCYIELGSYAYTTDELAFRWRPDVNPVELDPVINLPEYTITEITVMVCSRTNLGVGQKPCLRACFHLSRRLRAYLLNTYLPQFLVVLLSWLSFWIDPESVPARTSLSILTVLTITTQSSGLMRSMPSGSITKAIDVWMATCLVFVFGAFIEFSVVNTLVRKQRAVKINGAETLSSKSDTKSTVASAAGMEKTTTTTARGLGGGLCLALFNFTDDPATTVEVSSRILFPLTFVIFNLIYWPYYLL